jgi:hypothetical protein
MFNCLATLIKEKGVILVENRVNDQIRLRIYKNYLNSYIFFLTVVFNAIMSLSCVARTEEQFVTDNISSPDDISSEVNYDGYEDNTYYESPSYPIQPYGDTIRLRKFDQARIKALAKESAFQYGQEVKENINLWESFIQWLLYKLFEYQLQQNTTDNKGISIQTILFYLFTAGVVLFVIMKLLKIDITAFLYRTPKKAVPKYTISRQDINGIDFNKAIADAVAQEVFNEAVRFQYLKTLKYLSDEGLISWKIDKTNTEYSYELKNDGLKQPFSQLTGLFERIYYGNFDIDKNTYIAAEKNFQSFENQISKKSKP